MAEAHCISGDSRRYGDKERKLEHHLDLNNGDWEYLTTIRKAGLVKDTERFKYITSDLTKDI